MSDPADRPFPAGFGDLGAPASLLASVMSDPADRQPPAVSFLHVSVIYTNETELILSNSIQSGVDAKANQGKEGYL